VQLRQRARSRLLGQLLALDAGLQVRADLAQPGLDAGVVDVEQAGAEAGRRGDLGDAVAHGPGT